MFIDKDLTTAKELNELYIEYYNDFLTVECFARYKGFQLDLAKVIIELGRNINHDQKLLDLIYSN